jgi:hypothetical protein
MTRYTKPFGLVERCYTVQVHKRPVVEHDTVERLPGLRAGG